MRWIMLFAAALWSGAAAAQPMLPTCGPALDGQVSVGGCVCALQRGGLITGRSAGWRWSCDLLRGPGAVAPVQSAGEPAAGLPPGFTYAPQAGGSSGYGSTSHNY